jgi:hypothetical protein
MTHDFLGLSFIETRELVARVTLDTQKLVELRLNRLRVAVPHPLYEKGHEPNGQYGDRVPIKGLSLEQKPQHPVRAYDEDGDGVCREQSQVGCVAPQRRRRGARFARASISCQSRGHEPPRRLKAPRA